MIRPPLNRPCPITPRTVLAQLRQLPATSERLLADLLPAGAEDRHRAALRRSLARLERKGLAAQRDDGRWKAKGGRP